MRDLPAVPADLTPRRLLPPADNAARGPGGGRHGTGARRRLRLSRSRASVDPGLLCRRADAVQQGPRRCRRDAVQRRLPDHQGRAPHHAVALQPELRGQERLAVTEVLRRAGGRGAGRRPVDLVLGQRGDLLMARRWNTPSSGVVERVGSAATSASTAASSPTSTIRTSCAASRRQVPAVMGETQCGWALPALPVRRRRPRPWSCCPRSARRCGSSSRPAISTSRSGPAASWASGQRRPIRKGAARARDRLARTGTRSCSTTSADEVIVEHSGGPEIKMTATEIVPHHRRQRDQDRASTSISLNNGVDQGRPGRREPGQRRDDVRECRR